ncbi:leucine-rich repeat domain-containing protein [Primorskyibacter sp. S187A]|uniref:leucine-rich repeat domain-containing protein n=1 Tax=Primorskyibacter sp. S187A TaxID=3415130 RepID=UPI003C7CE267
MNDNPNSAELAYEAAEREIARVKAAKEEGLDLQAVQFHGLEKLPESIRALTGLTFFGLHNAKVSDFGPISELVSLKAVYLGRTQITDLTQFEKLTELKQLNLDFTPLTTVGALAGFPKLEYLDLRGSGVSDLSPLSQLTALEHLDLRKTKVADLSPLRELTELRVLYLDGTRISDASALAGLSGLRALSANRTKLSDVSPLSQLTSLTTLYLSKTQVSDLAPLAKLTALKRLDFEQTLVGDLRPLASLLASRGTENVDIRFQDIPALKASEDLLRISRIGVAAERNRELAAYLDTLPPYPEPLPWDQRPQTNPIDLPSEPLAPVMVDMGNDGRLHRKTPPHDLDVAQEALARQGWEALCAYLQQIAPLKLKLHNQMPMLATALESLSNAFGESFETSNEVGVGMQVDLISQLAAVSDEYLDTQDVITIKAFAAQADLYLIRFSSWQSFRAAERPDAAEVAALKEDAADFLALRDGLAESGLAGEDVLTPLTGVIESAVAPEAGDLQAQGLVSSITQINVTIGPAVLGEIDKPDKTEAEQDFLTSVHERSLDELKGGLLSNPLVSFPVAAFTYFLTSRGPISRLATRYPKRFGFMASILRVVCGG